MSNFPPLKPQLFSLFRPSKESHLVGQESLWTFSTLPVGFWRSRTLHSFTWDYPCPQFKFIFFTTQSELLSLFRPSKESHLVGRESPWTFSTLPVGFGRSRTLRSFPWDYPCPQWKPYLTRCEKSLEPFQGQRAKLWQTVNTGGFQHQWNRPWHDRHDSSRAVGTGVGYRGLN